MRRAILSVLVVLLSTSAVADATLSSDDSVANERIVRALFGAFNRHDVGAMAALYAKDAYLMSSDFTAPRHGPEAVRKTYTELFAQLPTVQDQVKTFVVKGEDGAVEFVSTWGANGNIPAGRLEIATFFTFKNGKITRDVTYFNVPTK